MTGVMPPIVHCKMASGKGRKPPRPETRGIGTRLCAAEESLVRPLHRAALVDADGDSTVRTHVPDIVVSLPWPTEFTARVQRNRFVERWHGHESELAQQAAVEAPRYLQAFADGDPDDTAVWFGEAAGLP
jgi:nitronate monooxygenase